MRERGDIRAELIGVGKVGTLDDDASNEFFDSIFRECLMWVWVYKGVLDFSFRLKIKRCIEIFLDTYFVLLGIFLDF